MVAAAAGARNSARPVYWDSALGARGRDPSSALAPTTTTTHRSVRSAPMHKQTTQQSTCGSRDAPASRDGLLLLLSSALVSPSMTVLFSGMVTPFIANVSV